jgi:hypothetical protein
MTVHRKLVGCFGLIAVTLALAVPAAAQAQFGLRSVSTEALNADGSIDLQAGSHPFAYRVNITVNQDSEGFSEGRLRNLIVELPAGFVGNPQAAPKCDGATFDFSALNTICPIGTQVGVARVDFNRESEGHKAVFNISTPVGAPARLGFSLAEYTSFQEAGLRPSDYGVNISDIGVPGLEIQSISETIWGVPADSRHDGERECEGEPEVFGCLSQSPPLPFLSLPTSCTGPLQTTVRVDSIEEPGVFVSKTVHSVNDNGVEAGLEGCEAPVFKPTITVQPENAAADSATGLHVNIHVPQNQDPNQPASAHLKDAVVSLPPGMVINPSAADGLGACPLEGPQGINLPKSTDPNVAEPAAAGEPAKCPASSTVGSVEVKTPLLDHPVTGTVYLARQLENPFGSLIALYIALEDPVTGIVVKVPGKVEPDPLTGQLKATFLNNPQLPFEDLSFDFSGGPRATLTTPSTCGTKTAGAVLTPWSTPEGATANPSSTFAITSSPNGSCPTTEAQMPNAPGFEAGTTTPLAGTYSPFVLKVSRENGSQRISSLDATLPEGLVGKLAGIPYCSDAAIAQAASRSGLGQGAVERADPSCPLASEVGTVNVGAGSGTPFYVQGHAYLAGPYKGAPLSLEIITPAVAGPFDLGTVAVRTALYVNPITAQIHAVSDAIPSILAGIPLDVRSIALDLSRPKFTLNPTSCDPMAVLGATTSTLSQTTALSSRFQVGGCNGLAFKPRLALRVFGKTNRNSKPRFRAILQTKPGEANIARAQVNLPHSEFLEQAHIKTICTRVQFNAGAGHGEQCPKASIYGRAKAFTPLLDKPLKGPVYLRSSSHKLPDLVAALGGQIDIALDGKVDTGPNQGIRNTFEVVPDAPVSKFILELKGGGKGLLVNSENLCSKDAKTQGVARFTGQNGKVESFKPKVANNCGGGKRAKKKGTGAK